MRVYLLVELRFKSLNPKRRGFRLILFNLGGRMKKSKMQVFKATIPLKLGLAGLLMITATDSVFAQNGDVLEEVIVTGSRIARDPNLGGPLPVQSISSDDIKLAGEYSLAEVLNDVPALLNSTSSETSVDSAFADGANILNLRGLGSDRTLVLVNGRRHVGGLQGSSAVDIGSIPQLLVDRVEILTGGASAVYGADAVTGVVNFLLKDDYDGFEIDLNYGISQEGDGQQYSLSALWGKNFDDDRGNIAVAFDWRRDDGLQVSDRRGGELIGSARDWVNPDLRFQQGDIGTDTPNFSQYFNYANTGLTNFGLPIPDATTFIADYNSTFGTDPTLTEAELALINRASNAPQRAVLPGYTFPFTSGYGYIIPGNPFTFDGFDPEVAIDLDNNGVPDCLDSFSGYNSVFGAASFGVVGGCWNVTEDGSYRPVRDGLVSGDFQGFGGDSFNTIQNRKGDIVLPDEAVNLNIIGHYDISETARAFGEFKYVTQEVSTDARPNSFWDLLFGAADNPFLPEFIRPVAQATGGVAITVDPIYFDNQRTTERDTYRFVAGIEGEFNNGWQYESSINYGVFKQEISRTESIINDRFFAALDAVTDPATGNPACRSEVDPTTPALNTPFEIPAYEAGYYSFTPGSGACVPINIWAGQPGITTDAKRFVTTPTWDRLELDQLVFSALVIGDSADWFELPGGDVQFVAGIEYREESSDATFDGFQRGVIPSNSPFTAGTLLEDVSGNSNLVFRPQLSVKNEVGEYDATDVYIEVSLPLLAGLSGVESLTTDLAVRYSDYSTIGDATTWKANLVYAPTDFLSFRGGVSQAVRAPNITELFGPEIGTTFRPADPCDAAQISAIAVDDPALAAQYQANCTADFSGIGLNPNDGGGNYVFADPLSASFGGVTGGNENLNEETADTKTIGLVFQSDDLLPGFSFTLDYWDISIDDAIAAVTSQDIVDGCYQGASLNQNFCQLFTRNSDPASAQYGGFNFLRSTAVNFAKIETDGYDLSIAYNFSVGNSDFNAGVQATKVNEINFFTNPSDLGEVNPELGEVNRPDLAGNVSLSWSLAALSVGWRAQYLGEQLVSFVEIETAETLYGNDVFMDPVWIHNVNASYEFSDSILMYGGINNATEEEPFATDRAFPVSPRGRYLFAGVNYNF